MAPVGPIIVYGLMVISASFYCSFDTVIQEKVFNNSNNSTNAVFNPECEAYECIGKALRLYENGKVLDEGFLTIVGVFSGFNSSQIETGKKALDKCLFEVNEKLNAVPRCSKFQTGMKLLELCADRNHKELFHATKFYSSHGIN